jgi:metabotropic X receptor
VIIFGSDQEVAGVMRAVRRANATENFSWIGSDGWSARNLVSDGNEVEVEGTLSVQPQANPVQGFEEYFLGLTVENNKRNPWFTGKIFLITFLPSISLTFSLGLNKMRLTTFLCLLG